MMPVVLLMEILMVNCSYLLNKNNFCVSTGSDQYAALIQNHEPFERRV